MNHQPWQGKTYLTDERFHKALSHAINRQEINNTFYFGQGKPRAMVILPSVSYYEPSMETLNATYDVALANRLLDQVGLTRRNAAGFRTTADGKEVSMIIDLADATLTPAFELVKEYWEAVGVRTTVALGDGAEIEERMLTGQYDALHDGWAQPSDERNLYANTWFWDDFSHTDWMNNVNHKEEFLAKEYPEGLPQFWQRAQYVPKDPAYKPVGSPPPDWYADWRWYREDYGFGSAQIGSAEYKEIGKKHFIVFAERVWQIGIVGMVPQPIIVSNRLGNFPDYTKYYPGVLTPLEDLEGQMAETLYLKN
jgi:peptide/nickel transport system substrate-binding protein